MNFKEWGNWEWLGALIAIIIIQNCFILWGIWK